MSGRNLGNREQIAEQKYQCYQLRLQGMTLRAISEYMTANGTAMSLGTVQRRLESEIAAKVFPLAAEVRQMELDRLDHYLTKLDPKIELGDDKAINTALRISERRAKLLGLDAPVQIDATVVEVTQAELELKNVIRDAKIREAAREQAILDGIELATEVDENV